MIKQYPHLAARVFNTPLLIHPGKLDAIIAGLGQRLLGAPMAHTPTAPAAFSTARGERGGPGPDIIDGVARIHIGGALVHRSRLDADSTYLQGYDEIAAHIETAMAERDVRALALVFDSPGGEAAGAFELAAHIHSLRGRKPMIAVVDTLAASAAYLLASAADEIVTTTTGTAGSIGVVARHVDFSQSLAADGVKVTHIFAGAHKVDGNPFEPLPDSVRADFQADVNSLYDDFIAAVAAHRNTPPEALRKTQAQVYRGVAAVAAGLADRIGSTDAVLAELTARSRAPLITTGPSAHHTPTPGAQAMPDSTTDQGALHTAEATAQTTTAAPALSQADLDAAHAAGQQAERERTAAILAAADEHNAPAALARQCIATGLSADQAAAILAAAPAAAPAAATTTANAFTAAMGAVGNPDVSGIETPADAATTAEGLATQVISAFRLTRAA